MSVGVWGSWLDAEGIHPRASNSLRESTLQLHPACIAGSSKKGVLRHTLTVENMAVPRFPEHGASGGKCFRLKLRNRVAVAMQELSVSEKEGRQMIGSSLKVLQDRGTL